MKSFFDRLNLRPAERRLVVGVGTVLFFILNLWFVVPHFSDLSNVKTRIAKARKTMGLFQAEIAQMPVYTARLKELESENFAVPAEEQNLHFSNTREAVAIKSGVSITSSQRIQSKTNQFFVELTQTIALTAKEQLLVNFLYNLGSGNSLIRVRDLSLRPDPSRQNLSATVKLAASYQKTSGSRPATGVQVARFDPAGANSVSAALKNLSARRVPGTAAGSPANTSTPAPE